MSDALKEIAREATTEIGDTYAEYHPNYERVTKRTEGIILAALEKAALAHKSIKPGADTQFLGRGKGYLHNRSDEPGGEGDSGLDSTSTAATVETCPKCGQFPLVGLPPAQTEEAIITGIRASMVGPKTEEKPDLGVTEP